MDEATLKSRFQACFDRKPNLVNISKFSSKDKLTWLFFRVTDENSWLYLMIDILKAFRDQPAPPRSSLFMGKSYFLLKDDLVYGWVMKLEGQEGHEDYLRILESALGISEIPKGPAEKQVPTPGDKPGPRKLKEVRQQEGKRPRRVETMRILGTVNVLPNKLGKGASSLISKTNRD